MVRWQWYFLFFSKKLFFAGKMRNSLLSNCIEPKQKSKQKEKKFMKNAKNKIRRHPASMLYIIASILALLLFAAGAIFALFRKSDDGISFVEKQKLNHVIEKSTAEYKQENEKLLTDFNKAIENAGKDKFNQARKNIPRTVKEFSKFKVNGKLAYKMAKDRIRKTNETRDAICSVVGPRVIKPCQEGHAELLNALQNYLHGLQENDNRYRAKLAQALNDIPANTEKSQARQDFLNDAVVKFEKFPGLRIKKTVYTDNAVTHLKDLPDLFIMKFGTDFLQLT
jgi:hypothetical protein